MALTLDPFATGAFSLTNMTRQINRKPLMFETLQRLGLFKYEGINTRTFWVERMNGTLVVIPSTAWDAPGVRLDDDKRDVRPFSVTHLQIDDGINPSEIAGIREFGTPATMRTYQTLMARKNLKASQSFSQTWELMMSRAIQGYISHVNLAGAIANDFNCFTEFDITQKTVDIALGTSTTNVVAKCRTIREHIVQNLRGESASGFYGLMSTGWADAFLIHANVKGAYEAQNARVFADETGRLYDKFVFGGITWMTIPDFVTLPDGSQTASYTIPADEAIVIPKGTRDTFRWVGAPAEYMETVNTKGLKMYARRHMRDMNKGVNLEYQSNPAMYCARPEILVKVTKS